MNDDCKYYCYCFCNCEESDYYAELCPFRTVTECVIHEEGK